MATEVKATVRTVRIDGTTAEVALVISGRENVHKLYGVLIEGTFGVLLAVDEDEAKAHSARARMIDEMPF